jgi:hypothetical protein
MTKDVPATRLYEPDSEILNGVTPNGRFQLPAHGRRPPARYNVHDSFFRFGVNQLSSLGSHLRAGGSRSDPEP